MPSQVLAAKLVMPVLAPVMVRDMICLTDHHNGKREAHLSVPHLGAVTGIGLCLPGTYLFSL